MSTRRWSRRAGRLTGGSPGRSARCRPATPDGTVLYSRPDPGNAAELTLVGASLERLLAISGPGLLIVCDSAMGQPKTLREIDQAGVRFVVPLRASAGFRERFLAEVGHAALRPVRYLPEREAKLPPKLRTVFKGALRDWEIPATDTHPPLKLRVAYIHSSEEATQVADARERALVEGRGRARADAQRTGRPLLQDPRAGRTSDRTDPRRQHHRPDRRHRHHPRRQADPDLAAQPGRDRHGRVASTGSTRSRRTSPAGSPPAQVLRLYKDQQIVERRHRDMKQTLKVRPIFLHNDDRVYALISIVGIALLIFGLIEAQTRAALGPEQQLPGLLPEGRAARPTGRNILAAFQGLGLTYTHTGIQLDPLTDTQQHILDLLQIQPPWPHTGRPCPHQLRKMGR